jgi:hypothetical protein
MATTVIVEAANRRYHRLTKSLEWPMALLALAVSPALLLDDGSATPRTHMIAMAVNWFVWVAKSVIVSG